MEFFYNHIYPRAVAFGNIILIIMVMVYATYRATANQREARRIQKSLHKCPTCKHLVDFDHECTKVMVDESYYPKIVFGPLPPKEKLRELIPWEAIGGNPSEPTKVESGCKDV